MGQDDTVKSNGKSGRFVNAIKIIMENWQRAHVMQGAAEMAYYLSIITF